MKNDTFYSLGPTQCWNLRFWKGLQPPPLKWRTPGKATHPRKKPCDGEFDGAVARVLGNRLAKNVRGSICRFRFVWFLPIYFFTFWAVAPCFWYLYAQFVWGLHFSYSFLCFCISFLKCVDIYRMRVALSIFIVNSLLRFLRSRLLKSCEGWAFHFQF